MINITKDLENKRLHIVRTFNAPKDKVWKAWTDSAMLEQWWGPKPWRAITKTMNFTNGGYWLYAMTGPDGTKVWSKVTYSAIDTPNSFNSTTVFCDEDGNPISGFPASSYWTVKMDESNSVTTVNVTVAFDELASLEQLVAMGFEGGFTMGLQQLEELLQEAN